MCILYQFTSSHVLDPYTDSSNLRKLYAPKVLYEHFPKHSCFEMFPAAVTIFPNTTAIF